MSADLAALNKQAILAAQQHMNRVAWPTVLLVAAVLAGFVATLGLFAAGLMPAWIATPLIAALTYMSYTPLHEAAHGNIHGGRDRLKWLNDLCGYLVAPIIMVPYGSHTVEHFTHHRYTNQPDKDPDYVVSRMGAGPVAAFLTVFRFLWVQNSFFVQNHWVKATRGERLTYLAEIAVSVGWRVAFLVLVSQPGTVAVIVLGYILGGLFTAYWFAYRPHIPYRDPARYRNTNSLIMPRWMKPFEWFWLGQNLHSIHHLFPRVPFYRYHALHREIEPVLRAHGTPIVGLFSRKPVPNLVAEAF
ncbi:fatty acid desaturase family protein [Sinimarinibacterium flocculans]|uniref:fatty acid desaturase family protein n=1 Tax=Sinimarinibacterium flocculans TaxID=985250 RepID=UPI003511759D